MLACLGSFAVPDVRANRNSKRDGESGGAKMVCTGIATVLPVAGWWDAEPGTGSVARAAAASEKRGTMTPVAAPCASAKSPLHGV